MSLDGACVALRAAVAPLGIGNAIVVHVASLTIEVGNAQRAGTRYA
jgi:hypothetical protein